MEFSFFYGHQSSGEQVSSSRPPHYPCHKSQLVAPDHLGGIKFDCTGGSGQTFDSPYQLWRATSSYSRKDLLWRVHSVTGPCTVPAPPSPGSTGRQTPVLHCARPREVPGSILLPARPNRPVPLVYSLNTEFQLCNNDKLLPPGPSRRRHPPWLRWTTRGPSPWARHCNAGCCGTRGRV
ncbi:unnamed protein product [Arctogadus glacialis]